VAKSAKQLDREISAALSGSAHARKRAGKPRVVHVEASTPANYRWLRQHARGATVLPQGEGFAVTDEVAWAQSLRAAEAREI
jgi:hypothetical protein